VLSFDVDFLLLFYSGCFSGAAKKR